LSTVDEAVGNGKATLKHFIWFRKLSSGSRRLGIFRLAWMILALSTCGLFIQDAAGAHSPTADASTVVTITQGTNFAASVSPDRSRIVLDLQGDLWILPIQGGTAKQITDWKLEASLPAWSPKGDIIAFEAFAGGRYHIWTIRPDGTELTQRTFGHGDDREPAWSPDGTQLAFASDRAAEGSFDIWQLGLADSRVVRRTTARSEEYEPSWSPDGKQIAFIEDEKHVVAIDAAGQRRMLASVETGSLHAPFWRPNSSDVIYTSMNDEPATYSRFMETNKNITGEEDVFPFPGNFIRPDEILYSADGRIKVRNLTSGTVRVVPFSARLHLDRQSWTPKNRNFSLQAPQPVKGLSSPRLSPDGKSVVVGALNDIYLLREGQAPRAITHDGFQEGEPGWSADGSSILYTSDKGGLQAIYSVDLPRGVEHRLTQGNGSAFRSALSPDGKRLAYLDEHNAVLLLDIVSGTVRKVADPMGREMVTRPSWSVDNHHIAFSDRNRINNRFREGYNEICVVDVQTSAKKCAMPAPFKSISDRGDSGPAWSPDGKWMAFIMESVLWVLPVNPDGTPTAEARRLTAITADSPSWSGDSRHILFIHNGKLVLADLAGQVTPSLPVNLTFKNDIPDTNIVIHAGRFWDGVSDSVRTNVDIVVRRDRIAEIRPHRLPIARGVVYQEAGDQTVMPGMMEMHSHPGSGGGYATRWWRSYLSMGVTSTQSMGGFLNEAVATREALLAGDLLGPRLFATGELFDGERLSHPPTRAVTSDDQLRLEIARQAALAPDYFKTYVQFPAARMATVATAARSLGIPSGSHYLWAGIASGEAMTGHLIGTDKLGYSEGVSATSVSYSDVIALYTKGHFNLMHTRTEAEEIVGEEPAMLDDPRIALLSPDDQMRLRRAGAHLPDAATRIEIARTEATLLTIVHAGGVLGLGTDAPIGVPGIGLQLGLRELVEGGFTPVEALRTVTSSAAKLIGVDRDLGTLAPGKLADLIIVDGNPLKDIRDAYRVNRVMKGGRMYTQQQIAAGFETSTTTH